MEGNYVSINKQELSKWLGERPESLTELAERIGKSSSFFTDVKRKEKMTTRVYKLFVREFSLPAGAFIKQEPQEPEPFVAPDQTCSMPIEHEDGYWLKLKYSQTNVKVQLMYKDEVIIGACSKIKNNTQLAFAQAISYATHMCYKFLEQKELEEKEPIK